MSVLPELRLALGMRGGNAIWMGGACSEIDRLRRAFASRDRQRVHGGGDRLDRDDDLDERRSGTYRKLLDSAGYGSVAVDVLAGASGGGLNSVLLSCSVVHGVRLDHTIRDLWLKRDLGGLVRHRSIRPPISLLDGDRAFYGVLASQLEQLVRDARATAPKPPPRMDVVLTCTLFTPVARTRYQDLGLPIVEWRNRAWFRFRSAAIEKDSLNDFGRGQQDPSAALRRLAYAAFATSSFPGAFEPAASVSHRLDTRPRPWCLQLPMSYHVLLRTTAPSASLGLGQGSVVL
jgi:patatin-related protein